MTIYPTDWVWFTHNGYNQFSRFEALNKRLQYVIDKLFTERYRKPYLMFDVYEKLDIHLVLPEEGEKYAEKVLMLSNGLLSPVSSIFRLGEGKIWVNGESPKFGPVDAFSARSMPRDGWKRLALSYVDWLCKFLHEEQTPTYDKVEKQTNKPLTMPFGGTVGDFLKRYKKLEESPMKVKQHLVELNKVDEEGKSLSKRDVILIKYTYGIFTTDKLVVDLVKQCFINPENPKHVTQDILTIEDGCYKIGSGDTKYTEERFKIMSSGDVEVYTVNMVSPRHTRFYFKYELGGKTFVGDEIIKSPVDIDVNKVLHYYQQRWPKKNYSLTKRIVKKELSERSKKLEDLPRKGETPAKELRKVCYKSKDGDAVHRAPFEDVKPLVDSGKYEFAPKAAWKKQLISEDGTLLIKGKANKSNITPSPSGKPPGERKQLREERIEKRNRKIYLKSMKLNHSTRIPGDAERKLQSSADKKKYAEKCVTEGKKRISHRASRAFEAVILGDKEEILETINIKAKSQDHADAILHRMFTSKIKTKKAVSAKLTGKIGDWKVQTGKSRKKSPLQGRPELESLGRRIRVNNNKGCSFGGPFL